MKSFTAVILDNLEKIKSLNVPIVLALTTDEETKMQSIKLVIKKLKELDIKPKLTIVGEPTNGEFCLSSSFGDEFVVKFFGKSAHSSKISQGVNAICACAKLVQFIEKTQKKYNLTSNCGKISGGEVVNKVPDYAQLSFDIRAIDVMEIEKFINEISLYIENLKNEYNGLKVEMIKTFSVLGLDETKNDKIQKIANELGIKTNTFSGGCEAGYYKEYSGDALIFGVGDLSLAHKPNEYVVVDEYNDYCKKIIDVLSKIKKYYF